ncbi:MAG: NUDIX domain-containing protein [Bacteroidia bacterium]|nr:NUDIX domain-containing protein [Bacteroidia bacterium]
MVFNAEGKVLLAQRGPDTNNEAGKWEFPGGTVEFGETCEQAVVREVEEELGIRIEVERMLDVVDHILPDEGQHWLSITYLARLVAGEPVILEPRKCAAIQWARVEEIREADLSFVSQSNLRKYLAEAGK